MATVLLGCHIFYDFAFIYNLLIGGVKVDKENRIEIKAPENLDYSAIIDLH